MVSERKQDSSSQTMPVEDKSDPPEGSEEAAEPRTDTPEGEGGRLLALQRGRGLGQWGAGVVMEAGILQGGGGVSPGPISWSSYVLYPVWQSFTCPPF